MRPAAAAAGQAARINGLRSTLMVPVPSMLRRSPETDILCSG